MEQATTGLKQAGTRSNHFDGNINLQQLKCETDLRDLGYPMMFANTFVEFLVNIHPSYFVFWKK